MENKITNEPNMEQTKKHKTISFKKGFLVTAAATALLTGCPTPNNPGKEPVPTPEKPTPEKPNPDNEKYGAPCDKILGNGNYFFHNFIGEKSGNLNGDTMVADVNHYLKLAESYTLDYIEDFRNSLKDKPADKAYFQEFIDEQANNSFKLLIENSANFYQLDGVLNQMNKPCLPVCKDIVRNIKTHQDRTTFIYLFLKMENESFFYGLGSQRNYQSSMTEAYQETNSEVNTVWNGKVINNPFDINDDVQNQNCRQITETMDKLLEHAASNMGLAPESLKKFINYTFMIQSMRSMHNISKGALKHDQCNANLNLFNEMYKLVKNIYREEQANRQVYTVANIMPRKTNFPEQIQAQQQNKLRMANFIRGKQQDNEHERV